MERTDAPSEDDAAGRLAGAADDLLGDYSQDKELTSFTALDAEAFHA